MMDKQEYVFLRSLVAHDCILRLRYEGEIKLGTYKLLQLGLLTRVLVIGNRSQIKTKAQWFNRKKKTNEFVEELRAKCVAANSTQDIWRSEYIALTPIGVKFVNNMNIS